MWEEIVEQGSKTDIGWYALNMARVEQGVPLFMIDFDRNNLPHETSLIQSRVRFDKGCYLGQEIVARMESLGQPKRRLVQLKMQTDDLPISGAQLWEDDSGSGTPVGVITIKCNQSTSRWSSSSHCNGWQKKCVERVKHLYVCWSRNCFRRDCRTSFVASQEKIRHDFTSQNKFK